MIVRALALTALVLGATSCRRSSPNRGHDAGPTVDAAPPWVAPVVVIDRVGVALRGTADGAVVAREYGRRLARCLIESGHDVVALASQAEPDRRVLGGALSVEIDGVVDGDQVAVTTTATMPWTEPIDVPPLRAVVTGQATVVDGHVDVATYAVIERLEDAVCRRLVAEVALLSGELGPGLTDDDPTLVIWTLELAQAIRPPQVAAAIVPLIDAASPVGDTALATLVALGDRSVVPALTARIDLAARAALPVRLDAVAQLGGPDAEEFLQVLTAHTDPAIARHARDGLARLREPPR